VCLGCTTRKKTESESALAAVLGKSSGVTALHICAICFFSIVEILSVERQILGCK
jgi:hypothetical protein